MLERRFTVDHSTVYRWVQAYAPELDKRCRTHLRRTNDSWRVDETYIEVKGEWKYLYRAVGSAGNTLDFMLSAKRDARAAERFFRKVMNAEHNQEPFGFASRLRRETRLQRWTHHALLMWIRMR